MVYLHIFPVHLILLFASESSTGNDVFISRMQLNCYSLNYVYILLFPFFRYKVEASHTYWSMSWYSKDKSRLFL